MRVAALIVGVLILLVLAWIAFVPVECTGDASADVESTGQFDFEGDGSDMRRTGDFTITTDCRRRP